MAMNERQDQAVQNTGAIADRLAGRPDSWAALGVHRSGHGGWEPARAGTGRTSQGCGLRSMLGGDSTGEATGSAAADRVRRQRCHFFCFWWKKAYMSHDANHIESSH